MNIPYVLQKYRSLISAILILYPVLSFATPEPPASISSVAGAGTIENATNANGGRVEFNSIQDTSNVGLRWGKSQTGEDSDKEPYYSGWSIVVNAPLDKSSSTTDLVNLNGLANVFTVGLEFSRLSFRKSKEGSIDGKIRRDEICEEMRKIKTEKLGKTGDLPGNKNCGGGDVAAYLPLRYDEFKNTFLDPTKWQTQWGAGFKIGEETFKFMDPDDFGKSSTDEVFGSVKFYYNFLPPSGQTMYGVGIELQREFKASASQTRCPSGGGVVVCQTGAFAKPNEIDKELIHFEVRRRLDEHAIAVKLIHDLESEVSALEVPVYIIEDKKEQLNGGIRIGYRDDTDEIEIGLFVGSSFGLF